MRVKKNTAADWLPVLVSRPISEAAAVSFEFTQSLPVPPVRRRTEFRVGSEMGRNGDATDSVDGRALGRVDIRRGPGRGRGRAPRAGPDDWVDRRRRRPGRRGGRPASGAA